MGVSLTMAIGGASSMQHFAKPEHTRAAVLRWHSASGLAKPSGEVSGGSMTAIADPGARSRSTAAGAPVESTSSTAPGAVLAGSNGQSAGKYHLTNTTDARAIAMLAGHVPGGHIPGVGVPGGSGEDTYRDIWGTWKDWLTSYIEDKPPEFYEKGFARLRRLPKEMFHHYTLVPPEDKNGDPILAWDSSLFLFVRWGQGRE